VYTDSSYGVPAIYLNDWPDRYIHTNFDLPAHLDPTKLKRAAFIGAASAWFLAMMTEDDAGAVLDVVESSRLRRTAAMLQRVQALHADEAANLARFHLQSERGLVESIERFVTLSAPERDRASQSLRRLEDLVGTPGGRTPATGDGQLIFRRNPDLRGPLAVFGYDYFLDHYGEERAAKLGLLSHRGARGTGSEYAYELLNLVDGRRTAQAIRDDLAAIYGPVPLALVVEYLRALETIEVVLGASSIEP
jgi:aminopeptidase YwaD